MDWTKEQLATIETTGKNILVSAAAGSGKTTVLVERIKNLVINEGADMDRFLITTFTKAAAAEMKERLEKAIKAEMKKAGADSSYLARQLRLLPEASIGTFHSFAIEIIRQYFHLTDLEPGFAVADEIQAEMMKREALDIVFSRRYREEYENFSAFLKKYSSDKGDDRLKEVILSTYRTLVSIPDYIDWAHEKAETLKADDPIAEFNGYAAAAGMVIDALEEAVDKYNRAAFLADGMSLKKVYRTAADDAAEITAVLNSARASLKGNQDKVRDELIKTAEMLDAFAPGRMQFKADKADPETKGKISDLRKAGKKKTDYIRDSFSREKFEEYTEEIKAVGEDTAYYIDIIEEFVNTFRQIKLSDGVMDFDDIMHYAIEILKSDQASEELRNKYQYIFVDEYQDSNNLQETIIRRISRENNLFMVGDVKQCIYRFRLAEPELFNRKAMDYGSEENDLSILLNLNSNFRSKSRVTEGVNAVFEHIMQGYDEKARLNCTAPEEYPGFHPELHTIIREDFTEEAPDKIEAEAAVAAKIIRRRLGEKIFDVKIGGMRPLTYRDFAVITRKNRVVEEVEKYLNNQGIPAYGEGSGRYFETVEVQVFINLLRVIDNMRRDIPLISAMRSVVFGFTAEELAKIRIGYREGAFSSAVVEYARKGTEEKLRNKTRDMIETLNRWKEISRTVPLEELMKMVLYDTGYYDYCSGLPVGVQRISNLRLIGEKASRYEQISHGGLYGFLEYIESMQSGGQSDSEAKIIGEHEDVVRVMSVHKSKGLEFPVVIFPDAAASTSSSASPEKISIHSDYGIGLPLVNRDEHWHRRTFLQKVIAFVKNREVTEEEIRILYVALTRAKDGFHVISSFKNREEVPDEISCRRFIDMMYMPLKNMPETEEEVYERYEETDRMVVSGMCSVKKLIEEAEKAGSEQETVKDRLIRERLGFRYPYEEKGTKSKYSVSQLNSYETAGEISVAAFEAETEEMITAARRGTIMHLLMEKADFAKAAAEGAEYLQVLADMLLAEETITAAEYDTMDIENAAAFFTTETGKRAAAAFSEGKLCREKEFILEKEINGEKTVVQGIIDCFFEEENSLVLVDYKNSFMGNGITEDELAGRYADQIKLYAEALESGTSMKVSEAYLYMFTTGVLLDMKEYI